jgi:hypothetical protein
VGTKATRKAFAMGELTGEERAKSRDLLKVSKRARQAAGTPSPFSA